MAHKVKGGYECGYCGKFFTDSVDADNCKEGHRLLYIPVSQEDLHRMVMFFYTKDDGLLNDKLIERLNRYLKASNIRKDE